MSENTPEYEQWKQEMETALDVLVAQNFKRLYTLHGSERLHVWGEIASNLYGRYGLTEIKLRDPEFGLKKKKEHCIYVNMEIYMLEEFPWELDNARTYRFVEQYGKLPKQATKEWSEFELEERVETERRREESYNRVSLALRKFAAEHSQKTL